MSQNSDWHLPQATASIRQFDILIGKWTMLGTHPELPSAVNGHSSFEWLRDGALLIWRFDWDGGGGIPSAYSVIGHDDTVEPCSMLYTDERGVSRIYQMSLAGGIWKMWRNSPEFSQRLTGTFSDDGNSITSHGELSKDGSTWQPDLSVVYTRTR